MSARPAKRGPGASIPADQPSASCGLESVLRGASALHPIHSTSAASSVRAATSYARPAPRRLGMSARATSESRRVRRTDWPIRPETPSEIVRYGRRRTPAESALPEKRMSACWPYGLNSELVVVVVRGSARESTTVCVNRSRPTIACAATPTLTHFAADQPNARRMSFIPPSDEDVWLT
ncbi:MAG: hypothetical protein HOQ11_11495 [Gemmatimonadaceae bacterium]|nr:hypothetical protein [Gemmatimonadaceae bacterium]